MRACVCGLGRRGGGRGEGRDCGASRAGLRGALVRSSDGMLSMCSCRVANQNWLACCHVLHLLDSRRDA